VVTTRLFDDEQEDADQRILMFDKTWADYEAQLEIRGEGSRPKIAFLDGVIELVTTSWHHERIKKWLARLFETYAIATDVEIGGYGEWTHKRKGRHASAEPDECYIFGTRKPRARADLVIEVVWKHGGLDKLEIYKRLGVPEVWIFVDGHIEIFKLRADGYRRVRRSQFLPDLDPDLLCKFLDRPTLNAADKALRRELRRMRGER
jgi:Uma2 family endonuclease